MMPNEASCPALVRMTSFDIRTPHWWQLNRQTAMGHRSLVLYSIFIIFFSCVCSASSADFTLFDKIIDDAWNNYVTENKVKWTPGQAPSSKGFQKAPCFHDHHINTPAFAQYLSNITTMTPELKETKRQRLMADHVGGRKRQITRSPIRIKLDTDALDSGDTTGTCYQSGAQIDVEGSPYTCTQADVLSPAAKNFIRTQLLPTTMQFLTAFLFVSRNTPDGITLRQSVCFNGLTSPTGFIPEIDFYTTVTSRPASNLDIIAYASFCELDMTFDSRPISGYINFTPDDFGSVPTDPLEFRRLVHITFHEFTHALGFTNALYDLWVDISQPTYPTRWPLGAIGSGTVLRTSKLVATAKEHFNCPSLTDVRLEDQGGSSTAGSHFEQQDYGNELMTGFAIFPFAISKFTLAAYADMGWYTPDFALAEPLLWGLNRGCGFPTTGACATGGAFTTSGYQCASGSQIGEKCSPSREARGYCDTHPAMDPNCHFVDNTLTYCQNGSASPYNNVGEFFGSESRCFMIQTALFSDRAGTNGVGGVCYQVRCSSDRTTYEVQARGKWMQCGTGSGTVTLSGKSILAGADDISISCPPASDVCADTTLDASRAISAGNPGKKYGFTNSALLFFGLLAVVIMCLLMIVYMILCCCCDVLKCCFGSKGQQPQRRSQQMSRI